MLNTSGGLNTRHGDMYQVQLLILCLKRGHSTGRAFFLTTENQKQAGSFDDIVIYQQEANGKYTATVIQAKHRSPNPAEQNQAPFNISSGELLNKDKQASLSIFKYFSSFCAIQQSQDFGYVKEFTLYTNADIKYNEKLITNAEPNQKSSKNVIYVKSVPCMNSLYKDSYYNIDFKKYQDTKENFDLIDNLKNVTGLKALAEELCSCIMRNKEINFNNEIFKIYQNALFDEVLEKKTTTKAVFKKNFIGNINLTGPAKILKKELAQTSWKALTETVLKLSKNFKNQSVFKKQFEVNHPFHRIVKSCMETELALTADVIFGKRFSSFISEEDVYKIAAELASYINKEKEICITGILKKYHLPLITEVVNVNESKFFENFVRAVDTSETVQLLSDMLKKEVGPLELISLKTSKEFREVPKDVKQIISHEISACEQMTKQLTIKFEELVGTRFSPDTPDCDIIALADYLAKSVHINAEINLSHLFTDAQKEKDYHIFLAKEVIDIQTSKFNKDFLHGENVSVKANKLSKELKERINIFNKNVKLSIDFKNVFVLPTKRLCENDIPMLVKLFTKFLESSGNVILYTENKDNTKCLKKTRILLEKITGHVLVYDENAKEKELLKFRSSFFYTANLRPDLKILRQKIHQFSKNNVIRLQKYFRLKITNFKTCYERQWLKLPSENDFTQAVQEFCNKFIFAKDQPNLENLRKQVNEELGDVFNLDESSNIASSLYEEMWKWILDKNAKEHDKRSVDALFDDMKNLICRGKVIGLNSEYCHQLRNHKIKFNSDCETIKAVKVFLNKEENLLLIQANQSTISTAIQTEQAVRENKMYVKEDNLIFLSSSIMLKDEAIKAFKSKTEKCLFVLVDDSSTFEDEKFNHFIEKLLEVIKVTTSCKKLIIITNNSKLLLSYSRCIDTSAYDDIAAESKKTLTKRKISYQGFERNLSDYPDVVIKNLPLNILLSKNEISIGKKQDDFADYCVYYSKRKVYQFCEIENDFSQLIKSDDVFVVEGMDIKMLCDQNVDISLITSDFDNSSCRIVITDDLFKTLILKSKRNKHNVRAIKFDKNKLFEAKLYSEDDLIEHTKEDNVVIIADTAGMGKSTFLTAIGRRMMQHHHNTWIVRIDFNKHTQLIKSDQNDFLIAMIESEAYSENPTAVEKAVFHHQLQNGSVLIMMDGFDEINAEYGEIVLKALQQFVKISKCKLWITTRTKFKEKLEKSFEIPAYCFEQFNDIKQCKYLSRFWQTNFKKMEKTNPHFEFPNNRFNRYADTIHKKMQMLLRGIYSGFLGQPLQLRMIAETFQQKNPLYANEQWENCFDYVTSEGDSDPKVVDLNIFELYDTFMNKIINLHLEKRHIVDMNTSEGKYLAQYFHKKQFRMLQHFGIMRMLNGEAETELLEKIIPVKCKKNIEKWKEFHKSGINDIGIINTFARDGQIHFIHLTFAEYFAASYIVENLFVDDSLTSFFFRAVEDILSPNTPVFLSFFISFFEKNDSKMERLKAEIGETTLQNYAARIGYCNLMVSLQGKNHSFPQNDKWGRNSLHYTVICEQEFSFLTMLCQTFCSILEGNKKPNERREHEKNMRTQGTFECAYKQLLHYVNLKDKEGNSALQWAPSSSVFEQILRELTTSEDKDLNTCYESLPFADFNSFYLAHLIKCAYDNQHFEFFKALMRYSVKKGWFTETMLPKIQQHPLWLIIILNNSQKKDLFKNYVAVILECTEHVSSNCEFTNKLESKIICSILLLAIQRGYTELFEEIGKNHIPSNYLLYFTEACFYRQHRCFDYLTIFFPNNISLILTTICSGTSLEFIYQKFSRNEICKAVTTFLYDTNNSLSLPNTMITLIEKNSNTGRLEIAANSKCLIKKWISTNMQYLGNISDGSIYDKFNVTIITEALLNDDEKTINLILQNVKTIPELENEDLQAMLNYYKFVNSNPSEEYFNRNKNIPDLHKAVLSGNDKLVEFFLQKGADVNEKDHNGKTPFQYACEQKIVRESIIELLLCFGAIYDVPAEKITSKKIKDILEAACNTFLQNQFVASKEDGILKSIWRIPFTGAKNAKNETWLHLLANGFKYENFRLLEKCYRYNIRDEVDNNRNTALHRAVQNEFLNAAFTLLKNGIMYNAENNSQMTAEEILKRRFQQQQGNNDKQHNNDLLAKMIKIFQNINQSFIYVQNNKVEELRAENNEFLVFVRDKEGRCLLHYAKELQMTTFLLQERKKIEGVLTLQEKSKLNLYTS